MKEIYVGNLQFDITIDEIRALFAPYGQVYAVDLHTEVEPRKPHAYAFVQMITTDADNAIHALNGMELSGQTLNVGMAATPA